MNEKTQVKPEVLAPAGNLEVLRAAVDFGADAVYAGGKDFGMRSRAKNFSLDDFQAGLSYAHARGARVYATVNIVPDNDEIAPMNDYMAALADLGIDALIVSDIGVLMSARQVAPEVEIHISTQTGVMNFQAARALSELGATRVVLAREMSLSAIRELRAQTPEDLEIEAFVHGSMCMAFSGRCMLSKYLINRDANHGDCAQSCRWKYHVVEEKRPGQLFGIEEDSRGTYLFNSQDMNMIEHVDDLLDAGVSSLKIEGRAKGAYYSAAMSNAYKFAAGAWREQRAAEASRGLTPAPVELPEWVKDEPFKVTHREYSTGFYYPEAPARESLTRGSYISDWLWLATVTAYDAVSGRVTVMARNKIVPGTETEILAPERPPIRFTVPSEGIRDAAGRDILEINNPANEFSLPCPEPIPVGAMLRARA